MHDSVPAGKLETEVKKAELENCVLVVPTASSVVPENT